jgi:hypothetical protein
VYRAVREQTRSAGQGCLSASSAASGGAGQALEVIRTRREDILEEREIRVVGWIATQEDREAAEKYTSLALWGSLGNAAALQPGTMKRIKDSIGRDCCRARESKSIFPHHIRREIFADAWFGGIYREAERHITCRSCR